VSVFIIAEAGVNHNGDIELAKSLVDIACDAQANAVKFQTFKASDLVTLNAEKADYQKLASKNENTSQFEMLKKLELSEDDHKILINYCNEKKILFLSSAFDIESINLLDGLGLEIFKIPSGEITNLPYLRHIGLLNKKIILSTGMANMEEIKEAMKVLTDSGTSKNNITILHANTMYPTPMVDVNLNAMLTIASVFGVSIGYSDHSLGIEVPIAAVAMGATVIEKHFTINNMLEGPDHKASLNPLELKKMVSSIRNIEIALGNGIKRPTNSEKPNIKHARKSIVAKVIIKKGEILSENNMSVKRSGGGISPMQWFSIIGNSASKDYQIDEII
jgi:N,N'-diacetyllegionaminate synthase